MPYIGCWFDGSGNTFIYVHAYLATCHACTKSSLHYSDKKYLVYPFRAHFKKGGLNEIRILQVLVPCTIEIKIILYTLAGAHLKKGGLMKLEFYRC